MFCMNIFFLLKRKYLDYVAKENGQAIYKFNNPQGLIVEPLIVLGKDKLVEFLKKCSHNSSTSFSNSWTPFLQPFFFKSFELFSYHIGFSRFIHNLSIDNYLFDCTSLLSNRPQKSQVALRNSIFVQRIFKVFSLMIDDLYKKRLTVVSKIKYVTEVIC